jgi:hypothetical protein
VHGWPVVALRKRATERLGLVEDRRSLPLADNYFVLPPIDTRPRAFGVASFFQGVAVLLNLSPVPLDTIGLEDPTGKSHPLRPVASNARHF